MTDTPNAHTQLLYFSFLLALIIHLVPSLNQTMLFCDHIMFTVNLIILHVILYIYQIIVLLMRKFCTRSSWKFDIMKSKNTPIWMKRKQHSSYLSTAVFFIPYQRQRLTSRNYGFYMALQLFQQRFYLLGGQPLIHVLLL